jgi:hypothetical protein
MRRGATAARRAAEIPPSAGHNVVVIVGGLLRAGSPISSWYRTRRIIRRALSWLGSDAKKPPRKVTPSG